MASKIVIMDEFYIGWEDKAPACIARRVRFVVACAAALTFAAAIVFAMAQHTIGVSVFEWGRVKEFSGILRSQPYPHLLVQRPGVHARTNAFSTYYLVNRFKFGFDPQTAREFEGQTVTLKGTLIYRDGQTMIETTGDPPVRANAGQSLSQTSSPPRHAPAGSVALGRHRFIGEIVDSKCYLGVMNPGVLLPHRACAIQCIRGGIPPILLVRRADGSTLHLLLVSSDGRAVNQEVLDLVAEPVEITGELEQQGDWLILRADPATYKRLPSRFQRERVPPRAQFSAPRGKHFGMDTDIRWG
ncbi:MAG: hypothetical protein AB1813_10950 [Verrucomicrobiota bacterium]